MRRSRKFGLGLNVGVLAVAAVAIGVVPVSTASSGGRDADFKRVGNDGVKEYPNGLVGRPAPDALKARAAVDAKAAVDRTRNSGFGPDMTPGTPQVELRLVSMQHKSQDESLKKQDFTDVLEWVVTYEGTRPTVHGPLYLDPQVRAAAMNLKCDVVFFVDAVTAELLHGVFQEC
ncbi:hypothetical protein [Dactylosporangium fulvum]|uniref:Secreted protein n=1 Tax=Dactylosporangium fulvum TaxID=53359 RepID=A0ABY5W003_9ACTN|nr:hypothetical protein [Dactylosporangium fulvum]UWP83362.1 hypothetical protein Dfulv_03385 [Dactylosporangium fulvum]